MFVVLQVMSGVFVLFMVYDYFGNVCELQSVIEGVVVFVDGMIDCELLLFFLCLCVDEGVGFEVFDFEMVECWYICCVLEIMDGNKSVVFCILGIDWCILLCKGFQCCLYCDNLFSMR